jgi:hypothetical protein
MWKPRLPRQIDRLTTWHVDSQQIARRNALVASTAMAQRRRERLDVEEFLEQHRARRLRREPVTAGAPRD